MNRDEWVGLLRTCELFSTLDTNVLVTIASGLVERQFAAGEYVVREGDRADSLMVVAEGELEVLLEEAENASIRRLGRASVLGEIAIVLGGERSASARALVPTRILQLSADHFRRLVQAHSKIMAPLSRALLERMRRGKIADHLQNLLGHLDPDMLRSIEGQISWVHLASGKELFRQGDRPDGAYIVMVGRLRVVSSDAAGVETVIEDSGPGEWVGEMALLTGKARSATVYAVRDTELVCLSQAVFDDLMNQHPKAPLETARVLVARLQRRTSTPAVSRSTHRTAKTFAVIATSANVGAREFAGGLAAALGQHGSVLHLTAARVDEALGKPGIARVGTDDAAQLRLGPWLIEQEELHDYVVFEADAQWTPWTGRSARHADHIVYVADARESPAPGVVERELSAHFGPRRAPRRSLVLLQPTSGHAFSGTARWLAPRDLDDHYHVRAGHASDVARLVRLLIGKAVCLVLGGGGSRGYAHLGVLRAFAELGIPVDAIGGTSIGAIIGGALAVGTPVATMLRDFPVDFVRAFRDPVVPVVSLFSGKRAKASIERFSGPLDIEDTAIPFFCISTNLTRGCEVVHRRGPAALAVRASFSVPGIFPPIAWNGDLLVDGGLSNNVPVDTMASLVGGTIVAVDVMPEVDLRMRADSSEAPPLAGMKPERPPLWRRIPFTGPSHLPDIMTIFMRSATAASGSMQRAEQSKTLAALYLRPPVGRWNMMDFSAADSVADEGYRGTFETIREWWLRERVP